MCTGPQFTLQTSDVPGAARAGLLQLHPPDANVDALPTPSYVVPTRRGGVTCLTYDTLRQVVPSGSLLQLSVWDVLDQPGLPVLTKWNAGSAQEAGGGCAEGSRHFLFLSAGYLPSAFDGPPGRAPAQHSAVYRQVSLRRNPQRPHEAHVRGLSQRAAADPAPFGAPLVRDVR